MDENKEVKQVNQEKDDRKYTIYMHVNKVNGKKYIGQTCQKLEKRWGKNGRRYLEKDKKTGKYHHIYFARAILKYGWNGFEHIILENNLNQKEADEKEKYYISKYKSNDTEYGYNLTEGGIHPSCWSEESNKKRSQAMKGRKASEETRRKMSKAQKGLKKPLECREKAIKRLMEYQIKNSALVMCVETEEVFSSIEANHAGFPEVTKKARKTKGYGKVKGYHWIMLEDIDFENWEKQKKDILEWKWSRPRIAVKCIETGEIFDSMLEAKKKTGIDNRSIDRCCKGKFKTAGGYHWEYVKEGDDI